MSIRLTLSALLLALAGTWQVAPSQEVPRRIRVLGNADGAELHQVRGITFLGPDLVVLTAPEPALHLFSGGTKRSWGDKGAGPAELSNPRTVASTGDRILVRDAQLRKIVAYDRSGRAVSTRPFPNGIAYDLVVAGRDTLLGLVDMRSHTVVRLRGARQDTVLRYPVSGETVQLSAPGSPSLSLPAPFRPEPAWGAFPDGRIAFWDGRDDAVHVLDRNGRRMARLALPSTRYALTDADREAWLAGSFPGEIRGQNPFAALREKARTEMKFPASFPPVLGLLPDARGGVWVLHTPPSAGQRWTYLAQGQRPLTIRLPARRSLLAVSPTEMAVHARDADGVETVEIYRTPQRPRASR